MTGRAELARHPGFGRISPEVGRFDEEALGELLGEDPDGTLALLAEMTGAVDPALRQAARRLTGRICIRLGRVPDHRRRGTGRLVGAPAGVDGELDLDASLEAVLEAAGAGRAPDLGELRSRRWGGRDLALVLVVDRSGSMGGGRLATAALAAAALAGRVPGELAVLAFAGTVTVVKAIGEDRTAGALVEDLLSLRGRGTSNLTLALAGAREELARSRARHRAVLLLSDCRHNVGPRPDPVVGWAEELLIVAPAGDAAEARALAAASGGRAVEVTGPSELPGVLTGLLA